MSDTHRSPNPRSRRILRVLALGGIIGLGASAAWAATQDHGEGGRSCHWKGGAITEEQAQRYAIRAADRALDSVKATKEQRAEIRAIIQDAVPEGLTLRSEGHLLRSEIHALFTADTIDRAALEELRQDGLELADRASALGVEVAADVAEVLTPAQRRQLAERAERWHR